MYLPVKPAIVIIAKQPGAVAARGASMVEQTSFLIHPCVHNKNKKQ
jgi:hypothetical protein